jgi:hypothetical protein
MGYTTPKTWAYKEVLSSSDLNTYVKDNIAYLKSVQDDGWRVPGSETWVYAGADDPTFTFTISGDKTTKYAVGQRIKLTQTTVKYFIITAVSYGAPDTTITIYGGTDYTLANAAISANYHSLAKAPFGFPLDPAKWTVEVTDTSDRSQASPIQNGWYNLGSVLISIPIGVWDVSYFVRAYAAGASAVYSDIFTTLSTSGGAESDVDFTAGTSFGVVAVSCESSNQRKKHLALAAKTSYYLNTKTAQASSGTIYNFNARDGGKCIIRAVCAYL